jgi:MFS family permease
MSTPTTTDAVRRTPGWLVAAAGTTVLAVVQGVFGSVGVLIDPLAAELGGRREQLVLLFAAALAVHTIAARHAGRALDRFGPRPLLLVTAVAIAFGLLSPALAGSVPMAVAGYGIGLGLASACGWVATAATVGSAFRGRGAIGMGLLTAGPAVGGAILAPTLTVLAESHGARSTCLALAAVGAVTCGAGALVLGGVRGAPAAAPASGPTPDLRPVVVAALLTGFVAFLPLVHVVAAATGLGLSATEGAAVLMVISTASAVTRIATGGLVRPGGLGTAYRLAHLPIAAGFGVWALCGDATAFPLLLVAGVLFGAGYGAWLALGPALLAEICAPDRLGRALGTLAAAIGVGGVAGPVLVGPLLVAAPAALWLGSAGITLVAVAVLAQGMNHTEEGMNR